MDTPYIRPLQLPLGLDIEISNLEGDLLAAYKQVDGRYGVGVVDPTRDVVPQPLLVLALKCFGCFIMNYAVRALCFKTLL